MKARKRQMVNISQHATWRWEQLKWPLCAAVCLKEPAREQDDRCNLHSCAVDHLVEIEQLITVAKLHSHSNNLYITGLVLSRQVQLAKPI